MPLDAAGIIGAIGGVAELAREAFRPDGRPPVPPTPTPPAPTPTSRLPEPPAVSGPWA
jgi:hypothetical protein